MFFVWQKFLHRCLTTHEKNVYQGRTIIKWPRIDHPSKGGRNRREYLRQQPRKSCSNPIELRSSILPFLDDQNEAMEVKGKSWWIAGCFPLQQTQRFDLGFLLCPSRNKPCGSSAPSSSSTRQTKNVCDSPKVTRHHGPSSSWEKKLGLSLEVLLQSCGPFFSACCSRRPTWRASRGELAGFTFQLSVGPLFSD